MNTTLKKVIGQFLNSADQSSHQFLRLYNMGKFGLETEFNLDITGTFKTLILDVNGNKTVNLPCDYITYKKIGFLNGKGEVVTLKRNNQLSTLNTNVYNRTKGATEVKGQLLPDGLFPYDDFFYNNYFYNGVSYRLFGADSGTANRGEYKVDDKNKLIFLNPDFTDTQVVVEYLSDGYDEGCCDYDIDIRAARAMLAFIRWQDAIDQRKKFSQSHVNGLMKDFYREKRLTAMRLNPFVLNEMQDAIRQSVKMVSKS